MMKEFIKEIWADKYALAAALVLLAVMILEKTGLI